MAQREAPPPKKDVARALLLRGSVFVYLDPRRDGVVVPPWYVDQPQLVLQIGLDLPVPILDLRVDDLGVFGTLSFNRAAFTCAVPWSAVFAVAGDDGMGMVWAEDMPTEIAAEVDVAARRAGPEVPRERKPRPRLRAIDGSGTESGERAAEPQPRAAVPEGERKRPPYLRVVK